VVPLERPSPTEQPVACTVDDRGVVHVDNTRCRKQKARLRIDAVAKGVRRITSRLAGHVEPLNRFETSFLNLAEQVIEVVDRVGHPNCQIMLDTFHMNIEEKSSGDAIRAAGKRLKHLHSCENDRGAPGSGQVAWQEVAQALWDIGYAGPVVIESFTAKVKSIARAAAIWRPLASSQDALAADGLKFLRQLLS